MQTQAIQIQPGFNPCSSASADRHLEMFVSSSVFVLRLLTAQELITFFWQIDTYIVSGPNLAIRCVVESRCHQWHNAKLTNSILYAILPRTEKLPFAVNGQLMHRRSRILNDIMGHVYSYISRKLILTSVWEWEIALKYNRQRAIHTKWTQQSTNTWQRMHWVWKRNWLYSSVKHSYMLMYMFM